MCLFHVFLCVQCERYSEIPIYRKELEPVANIFTDVVCSVPGCSVRKQVLRLSPNFKVFECLNTLCNLDTCSTVVISKSCRQQWELEPDNYLPVRIVQERRGVYRKTVTWYCSSSTDINLQPLKMSYKNFQLITLILFSPWNPFWTALVLTKSGLNIWSVLTGTTEKQRLDDRLASVLILRQHL